MLINEAEKIVSSTAAAAANGMHTNTQQARWSFPSKKKKHIVLFFSFSSPVKNVTRVHVCVHVHGNKRHTNTHIKGRCCPVLRSDRNPHPRAKLASSERRQEDVSKVRQNKSRCQSNRWQPGRETLVPTVSCQRCHWNVPFKAATEHQCRKLLLDYHFKMFLKFCTFDFCRISIICLQ